MDSFTKLANVINAIEDWEIDFEEEVAEDVEEALKDTSEIANEKKISKLDKLLLLLDPKFSGYLKTPQHKLPIDGKTKKEEK